LRKTAGSVAAVVALGVIGVVPASAGQSAVVPGGIYKGTYVSSIGMEYKTRIKVYDSGKAGNFSLKCAGIQREKIQIAKGKFELRFGADEIQVKGRGRFKDNDRVKGEITKIVTPGSTCSAPGDFIGILAGD
jgi:hypothetical protein